MTDKVRSRGRNGGLPVKQEYSNMKIGSIHFPEKPLFLAPMEDVTDIGFRVLCKRYGAAMVYSEFVSAEALVRSVKSTISKLTIADEERPVGIQIYGRDVPQMVEAAQIVEAEAHPDVIDLNFGCPSPTVTSRGRGAGILRDPEEVDRLLDGVFLRLDGKISISVKTRIGMEENLMPQLIQVYNQYPLSEVTVHPRLGNQGYKGSPDLESYGEAAAFSTNSVVYNGDILKSSDAEAIMTRFPETSAIMIGRGLVMNPALAESILGIAEEGSRMKHFQDRILRLYRNAPADDGGILARMKELWGFWVRPLEDEDGTLPSRIRKHYKALKKSRNMAEYVAASEILMECIQEA